MIKKILILFLTLSCTIAFSQKVAVLTGPSGIPCAKLMDSETELQFEVFPSAQNLLPKLIKGEVDIGFLPPNAAVKVYNTTGKIVCLGITGNGNIYLISKSNNFSLKDLEGKTVACAGMGATPQYISEYIFEKNEIKDVTLDFSTPNPQIAAMVKSDKFQYAIVPEPFATLANSLDSSIQTVLNIQGEYKKIENKDFPMTLLVANADYAKNHKKEIKKFIAAYKKAQEWTLKNPAKAGELSEKHSLLLKAKIVEKAIPTCAFTWVSSSSKDCKEQVESLLNIFLKSAPQAIGEKLPDSNFYYR